MAYFISRPGYQKNLKLICNICAYMLIPSFIAAACNKQNIHNFYLCFWGLNFFILLWFCRIPGTVCWRKLQRDTTHQLDMLKLRQSQTSAPLRYQFLLQKALLPSIKIPQSWNQVLDFGLTAIHVVSAELHHAGMVPPQQPAQRMECLWDQLYNGAVGSS